MPQAWPAVRDALAASWCWPSARPSSWPAATARASRCWRWAAGIRTPTRPHRPVTTANNLRQLDAGLAALRAGLVAGQAWRETVVVVATEFGREVAINGTLGTDHGSGGAAFVLGGGIQGGRVIADWPGLARKDRFEGRDLRTTLDLRAVLKGALHDHLQVARRALDTEVFPGSEAVKPLTLMA